MHPASIDFLIIGQGLAGSILAAELRARGRRVLVLDDDHATAASRVAAGLLNPLAGMRFNLATDTRACLDAAHAFYAGYTGVDGAPVYHPVDMLRVLRSPQQRRFHERRLDDPHAADLLGPWLARADGLAPGLRAPHGLFRQFRTAYLDTRRFLAAARARLAADDAYLQARIRYAAIRPVADLVHCGGHAAANLVFCEGARLADNPWFGHLPLQPDKGEILTVESDTDLGDHIVNGAHWLLPTRDGRYRLGSTHDHVNRNQATTPYARRELLAGLHALFPGSAPGGVRVTGQLAGVRPATSDRAPFLGRHPDLPRLWVFNGFGARGSLTIPWHARRMVEHMLDGAPLPARADIGRYA